MGWLNTVQGYYENDVKRILDAVTYELNKNSNRRFIQVETGFFWRWWNEQNSTWQATVRNQVTSGQLEFINGGWCMNDEAAPHYNEIIDQMTLGLRYLNDTFGECAIPRAAWQIDPFGHSREQANLFAEMGFDGQFFARIDHADRDKRRSEKNMETIWQGRPQDGTQDSWLFSSVLYDHYSSPGGFCFECGDSISNDPESPKVSEFIGVAERRSAAFQTGHLITTMGDDFRFKNAGTEFENMDRLITNVNLYQTSHGTKVNVLYSSPSCYIQAVNREQGVTWSTKKDDFFPYSSGDHSFWTGYFTSRPTFKNMVRKGNNLLQACKQLAAATDVNGDTIAKVFELAEPMAVSPHHDAVSGTAKQFVTDEYAHSIHTGVESCQTVVSSALNKIDGTSIDREYCQLLNISTCASSESSSVFTVSVYNPLARSVDDTYIRLPVPSVPFKVEGPSGEIPSQTLSIPQEVLNIPGRQSNAQHELVFPAGPLAGLSVTNFKVTRLSLRSSDGAASSSPSEEISQGQINADFTIENSVGVTATFDGDTGLLKKLKVGDTETNLAQNFYYYQGMNRNGEQKSGAYVFRPDLTATARQTPVSTNALYTVVNGEQVTEVRQVFSDYVSQVIRLYDTAKTLEFEWLVGPIPVGDNIGKEIITRFSTDMNTNGIFYTDAGGRQLVERKRDHRDTWDYNASWEPESGNYYPVNSRMLISEGGAYKEGAKTLVVLNDRSQGGTSLNDGELEFMVHRRLLVDDGYGVGEALNEQAFGTGLVARGKFVLAIAGDQTGVPTSIHRPLGQQIFIDRILSFSNSDAAPSVGETQFTKLAQLLPPSVHVLTLEKVSGNEILLRLEHIYDVDEDSNLSANVNVETEDLQNILGFKSIRETTLGGNRYKDEVQRFSWNVGATTRLVENNSQSPRIDDTIELKPQQIRSFLCSL